MKDEKEMVKKINNLLNHDIRRTIMETTKQNNHFMTKR